MRAVGKIKMSDDSTNSATHQVTTIAAALATELFSLREPLRDVCLTLSRKARFGQFRLKLIAGADSGAVEADPNRLTYVVAQLIQCVVQHVDSGEVSVTLKEFAPKPSRLRQAVAVRICITIEAVEKHRQQQCADVLEREFERQQEVSASDLNFEVALEWLATGGGVARLSTSDRPGLLLTFELPCVAEIEPNPSIHSGLQIAIVGGEPLAAEAVANLATELGHTVHLAQTVSAAEHLLAARVFDAVFISSDLNSAELPTRVRSHGLNASTLMILLSAADDFAAAHDWPFDGVVAVPPTLHALQKLIGSKKRP